MHTPEELAHDLFRQSWGAEEAGDLDKALELIGKALQLNPVSAYWVTRGPFLSQKGELEKAAEACRKSVEIDPENHHGWVLLGQVLGEQGRFEPAVEALQKAVALNPAHHTYTILAAAQLWLSPRDAVTSAQKALELKPDWKEAKKILEQARTRQAEHDR